MKKYKEYMDGIEVSDTLHQRLLALEPPAKRPVWVKYGAVAAALMLVCGLGGFSLWAAGVNRQAAPIPSYFIGYQGIEPEIGDAFEPDADIAPAGPGDVTGPGMKTIGGYEVTDGGMTSYFVLPYIEYGMAEEQMEVCLDWDVPAGAVKKDLTREDIAALFGGAGNLSDHLDWGGYELSGWAAWYGDGSFWGIYLYGCAGPLDHFEFAATSGALPPTCICYPESVEQEIQGITVTADGHDSVAGPSGGVDASSRRVSFLKDGCGYRFDLTGVSRALTEERVGRLVRWLADRGLALDAITSDGAAPAHPWEADTSYSVGEPNWDDSGAEPPEPAETDPTAGSNGNG